MISFNKLGYKRDLVSTCEAINNMYKMLSGIMEHGDAWSVRLPVTQYNQAGSNLVCSANKSTTQQINFGLIYFVLYTK